MTSHGPFEAWAAFLLRMGCLGISWLGVVKEQTESHGGSLLAGEGQVCGWGLSLAGAGSRGPSLGGRPCLQSPILAFSGRGGPAQQCCDQCPS